MGTTLTGTTPQDTYDSLIKVTDNGPLSGTLKALSDGLGNDSTLSLSTTAASIAGTLAVSGATTLAAATVTSVSARNSGVPALQGFRDLDVTVVGSAGQGLELGARDGATYKAGSAIYGTLDNPSTTGNMVFQTRTADALTTKMTITSTGNVAIGTSSPVGFAADDTVLQVNCPTASPAAARSILRLTNSYTGTTWGNGSALVVDNNSNLAVVNYEPSSYINFLTNDGSTIAERVRIDSNGLTFNGDTAAANALDDYEEGTWTMGISFGGASVGVSYNNNSGAYTKIGRQVTVTGWVNILSVGSSSGAARITGLPFTVGNTDLNYAATAGAYNKISYANQLQAFAERGTTTILLTELTEAGVETTISNTDFQAGSYAIISLTYFV